MKASNRSGFTLVELLVVIAIIAVIMGLIMPFVARAREKAEQGRCVGNLRNTYSAARLYSADHDGDLVPAFIRTDGETDQWPSLLVKYFSEDDNRNSEDWACPAYDKDEGTAWDWGYGINETPRYRGDASTSEDKRNTRITYEGGSLKGNSEFLKWINITEQSRRLMFCEASEWFVNPTRIEEYPVYNRHGSSKCVVVFFDGHIDLLTPTGVRTSVYDPENFTNVETAIN